MPDDDFPHPHLDAEDDPNYVAPVRSLKDSVEFRIAEIDNGWMVTVIKPDQRRTENYFGNEIDATIALLEEVNRYGKEVKQQHEKPF